MSEEKQYPSLPEQGKNLASFTFELMKKALRGESLTVSAEVKEQRLEICRNCNMYDPEHVRCMECGCMLEYKTGYALYSCPLEKWKESDADWVNGKFEELVDKIQNDEQP